MPYGCSRCKNISLIHLFGVDGTGKTTLAYLLEYILKTIFGFKCVVIRKRRRSPLNDFLVNFLSKLIPEHIIRGGDGRIIRIYGIYKLIWLWLVFQIIGMKLWYIFRIAIPKMHDCIIILDRYIIDMIVSDTYFFQNINLFKKFLCIYTSVFRKELLHAHLFHVNASIYTIVKRRGKESDPLNYLVIQGSLFRIIAKIFDVYEINTDTLTPIKAVMLMLKSIFSEPRTS